MQLGVVTGQTQFGRGGGASSAPCGWWVAYAYEAPAPWYGSGLGATDPATSGNGANLVPTWTDATVHVWTDNAVTNALGAVVLAALAACVY